MEDEFYDDDDSSYDDDYVDPDGLADELEEEEEDWDLEDEGPEEDRACGHCGVGAWDVECGNCDTLLCSDCIEDGICPVCGAEDVLS